ncbi:hypothetical protein M8J75_010119 [Diaphorina citri]|nr:hypothetical protein M8J75_010119 [Diaphorina citri]
MWLPGPSVAIVTGASTGIGYNVVQDLVRFYDGTVYMTCINETAGLAAVDQIKKIYENETIPTKRYYQEKIKFYRVDVSNESQVENFTQHIAQQHGGVDVLINNAAVHLDYAGHLTKSEKLNRTMEVNYFGLLRICHFLFPLLRQSARVIHVTSQCGHVSQIRNGTELQERFLNDTLTEEELTQLMHQYVEDYQQGRHLEKGWPESPYTVSKIGVSKLAMVQQNQHFQNGTADLSVNAVNPGYAKTQMSNFSGLMEADEAGDPILYLASIQPYQPEPRGQLIWNNKEEQAWNATPPKTFDHPSKCAKYW